MTETFKLCYAKDGELWFTTAPIEKQWGDDWSDVPWECNAGMPYVYDDHDKEQGNTPWVIALVTAKDCVTTLDQLLDDRFYMCNSPFSVKDINRRAIAWADIGDEYLHAGATLEHVLELLPAEITKVEYLKGAGK